MTDKELMELAANAAGLAIVSYVSKSDGEYAVVDGDSEDVFWNPLTDDGDALRLAVKLRMDVYVLDHVRGTPAVEANVSPSDKAVELLGDAPCAATRRAIVRAAAEIGKGMK